MMMASSKEDDIVGVAIDMADIGPILFKWFGGSYNDIVNWKEKAKRWDNYVAAYHTTSRDVIEEWKEKARLWDKLEELRGNNETVTFLPKKELDILEEKANKYDEIKKLVGLELKRMFR